MNPIIAVAIANIALIGAILMFFWSSWLDFIRPDWFYVFRIYEHDFLNYKEEKLFLPFKGKKDAYLIGMCEYDKGGFKPSLNGKGVFTWDFLKGQNKPLEHVPRENIDGKLIAESKKQTLDALWFNGNGIEDFMKTWGVVIIGCLILLVLGYFITKNSQDAQITRQILINLTRRG